MTTPHDPEEPSGDEPAGDELPEQPAERKPDRVSVEDALWRSIIDNYGERPAIDEPEVEVPVAPRTLDVPTVPTHDEPPELADSPDPEDHHYVPPVPPPLPTPPPARLLAWAGLFGVPTFVLIALVAQLVLPAWLGLVLMFWFVGGFVFLVASMGPGQGDDYDDGARL